MVLDVYLPDLNGLDLQKLVDQLEMPIIFITGYGDVPTSVQAMKAGADEFLIKPFSEDVLLVAIRDAIDRSRSAIQGDLETQTLKERYASLSARTRGDGVGGFRSHEQTDRRQKPGISIITVKSHRGKVMRKMKARSVADLVIMSAKIL